jgi:hypothetical protein
VTWNYSQSKGELDHDGAAVGVGYSGHGDGMNNPDDEAIPNVGPIPAGDWSIGAAEDMPHLGPVAMPLTPQGHNAHGRFGFFIHGDNPAMNRTASDGCIILSRPIREQIAASGDTDLNVTP